MFSSHEKISIKIVSPQIRGIVPVNRSGGIKGKIIYDTNEDSNNRSTVQGVQANTTYYVYIVIRPVMLCDHINLKTLYK